MMGFFLTLIGADLERNGDTSEHRLEVVILTKSAFDLTKIGVDSNEIEI